MRLVYKLTASLLAGICLLFAAFGYLTVQREVAMFDLDMVQDARLVCLTLAEAIERINATGPGADAAIRELVERASRNHAQMSFRLVRLDGADGAGVPALLADRLRRGEVVDLHDRDRDALRVLHPLSSVALPGRALELVESLEDERSYVRATIARIAATAVFAALLAGVLAFILGARLVGRPMQLLTEKVRRVGHGDLQGPVHLPQRDEIGHLARAVNAMCDELRTARDDLAEETTRRIQALEQLRHAERLVTVGRLAAGVAHELGTPLNVILGRARLITADPQTSADARASAAVVAEQSQRIKGIIDQLLGFARRRQPHASRTDLRTVVRHAVSLLEPMATKAGVEVRLAEPPEPLTADLDPGLMQQVVTNLLVNAMQAMPDGGPVDVTVERLEDAAPPPGHAASVGPFLRLAVRDRGAGIAPDDLPQIFEPFFTTKPVGAGTGLGLPVSHGIVAEHGGWIDVRSDVGAGSTFQVYLPSPQEAHDA